MKWWVTEVFTFIFTQRPLLLTGEGQRKTYEVKSGDCHGNN